MDTVEPVPVARDLFTWSDGGAALIGTRCTGCGTHYFPKSLSCRNPGCARKAVEDVHLGRRGHLYSFTVQSYRPPALFRMEPFEPYALGLVDLPEGPRVLGMLTGRDPSEIRIGMPVRLVAEALYTDDSGRAVLTYKYAPVPEGEAS
jgi:uncharacterized protein